MVTKATTSSTLQERMSLDIGGKERISMEPPLLSRTHWAQHAPPRTELRIWTLDWFCEAEHLQSLPQHLHVSRPAVTFRTNVCLEACDEDGRVSHSATTCGLYSSALALSIRRASPNFCMKAPKVKVYPSSSRSNSAKTFFKSLPRRSMIILHESHVVASLGWCMD